jgi:ornithine carbamoyltransferase
MSNKQDFLSLANYSQDEIYRLLSKSMEFKRQQRFKTPKPIFQGLTAGLIFNKPSTRTRVSFAVAMNQLGGTAIYLNKADLQLGRGETIADTARVLSRYLDVLIIRTYSHLEIEELARHASIPVINALTDSYHPCQALADLLTILEKKSRLAGLKLAYVGDGNNVCNSLLIACARMGISISVASPEKYQPKPEIVKMCLDFRTSLSKIEILTDPIAAVEGADVIYTDVWTSMGQEKQANQRLEDFSPFQVNSELVKQADSQAIILHCLPAHRGQEITDEVIDSPQSVVLDQAENRLHTAKAILSQVLKA